MVALIPCTAAWSFPTAYYAKGSIYLPYGDILEPFEAWVDMESGKSRLDTYNGKAILCEVQLPALVVGVMVICSNLPFS